MAEAARRIAEPGLVPDEPEFNEFSFDFEVEPGDRRDARALQHHLARALDGGPAIVQDDLRDTLRRNRRNLAVIVGLASALWVPVLGGLWLMLA